MYDELKIDVMYEKIMLGLATYKNVKGLQYDNIMKWSRRGVDGV